MDDLESDAWLKLGPYMEAGPLSLEGRRLIRSTIGTANSFNELATSNIEVSQGIAKELGVAQVRPKAVPADFEALARCEAVVLG